MLSAAFGRAARIPIRIGFAGVDGAPRAAFFTNPVEIDCGASVWDNFTGLARVAAPALPNGLAALPPAISDEARRWAGAWLSSRIKHPQILIAFHLGAAPRMAYRCWPLEFFLELAQRLRRAHSELAVLLTGTPAERAMIDEFAKRSEVVAIDATQAGSVERTSALLEHCCLLVSNDTGVMHLGAALGIKTLGLFGPSNPQHWAPRGAHATYLYATRAPCSPCIDVYHRIAPADCFHQVYQQCLHDLSPARVFAAVEQLLKRAASTSG